MIARKTEEGIKKGSAIRAMFTEGKAMAERYGAENVYDYSLGNPAVPAPEKLKSRPLTFICCKPYRNSLRH